MSSAMDVDGTIDPGVDEMKGEGPTAAAAAATATAETTQQKGKGEGDRNLMLHPVWSSTVLPRLTLITYLYNVMCCW